jgi:hypothetical protein
MYALLSWHPSLRRAARRRVIVIIGLSAQVAKMIYVLRVSVPWVRAHVAGLSMAFGTTVQLVRARVGRACVFAFA